VTRVAVVGAGSWGTAVAAVAAGNVETTLWARREELAIEIRDNHENPTYLPDIRLPSRLHATSSLEEACTGADVLVLGVPSHGLRTVLSEAASFIGPRVPVVSLAKGIEQGTLARMTEVACEVLTGHEPACIGVLTGPNLAREVAAGQPTASVVAMTDPAVA
jgi:glycerol-3-phosphate dehydrogenase (NAD(P)+)